VRTAYLGLGSNLGDRVLNLREALRLLVVKAGINIVKTSAVYETKPVGVTDQPDFLNMVVLVATYLSPRTLLARCQTIESELGRVRREHWGPRTLDIDLLWFDELVCSDSELVLPHPRVKERGFVLVPLAEIAPGLLLDEERADILAARVGSEGLKRLGPLDSLSA
jgi:2-amino-4-hydroxy-6-hydroxymethyldihydropteridine diphosphokinase